MAKTAMNMLAMGYIDSDKPKRTDRCIEVTFRHIATSTSSSYSVPSLIGIHFLSCDFTGLANPLSKSRLIS